MNMHEYGWFLITYDYLGQTRWNLEVGYVINLKPLLCEIFSNLVNYEKLHMWPQWFVWTNYVNKGVYREFWVNVRRKILQNL